MKRKKELNDLELIQYLAENSYERDNYYLETLIKREVRFKKTYKVYPSVYYISGIHRSALSQGPRVRGLYRADLNLVVVFIDEGITENKNAIRTLYHELTHAYQAMYMTNRLIVSCTRLEYGMIEYKNAWHERHARGCAQYLLDNGLVEDIKKITPESKSEITNEMAEIRKKNTVNFIKNVALKQCARKILNIK